jgi:transposase, IS30 family
VHKLTPVQKRVIAELAAAGVPSRRIAREIGRAHRTVHDYVEALRRRPPRVRCRSDKHLSFGRAGGDVSRPSRWFSLPSIATGLGRDLSTVCREVSRNGGRRRHRAARAEDRRGCVVGDRNRRDSRPVLSFGGVVEDRLGCQWLPQQISRSLRVDFASRPEMQVSHETIYLSLFVQGRGALLKELTHELRRGHATRRPRSYSTYKRHSRFVMLVKIRPAHQLGGHGPVGGPDPDPAQELFRSLTWDQGKR